MRGRSWRPDVTLDGPDHSPLESLLKALIYRLFMIALTVIVAYVFTTDTTASLQIGLVANGIKTGTYYAYERIWDRLTFGGWFRG